MKRRLVAMLVAPTMLGVVGLAQPAQAATPKPIVPTTAQVGAAQTQVDQQSGSSLQLIPYYSQTFANGITVSNYVALPEGAKVTGSPSDLAANWTVTMTGVPGSTQQNMTLNPPVPAPALPAPGQVAAQKSTAVSHSAMVSQSGAVSQPSTAPSAKEVVVKGLPKTLPPTTAARIKHHHRKIVLAEQVFGVGDYLWCVFESNAPAKNYLYGYGVAVAVDGTDCNQFGEAIDDVQGWEYPKGAALDQSANHALVGTEFGWAQSNQAAGFCKNSFPIGWWTLQRGLVLFPMGFGSLGTGAGGLDSPAVTLACAI